MGRGTGRGLCMSTINPVRGEEGGGERGGGGIFHLAARKQDVSPSPHPFSCTHIHIKVTGFGGGGGGE